MLFWGLNELSHEHAWSYAKKKIRGTSERKKLKPRWLCEWILVPLREISKMGGRAGWEGKDDELGLKCQGDPPI